MNWGARFSRQVCWLVAILAGSALLFRMSTQDTSQVITYLTGMAAAVGWIAFPFKFLAAADDYSTYAAHLKSIPNPDRESLTFSYRMVQEIGEYWFYSCLLAGGFSFALGVSVLVAWI